MVRRMWMVLVAAGLLSSTASVLAQQPSKTPEMPAVVANFWKRLAKARTVTFTIKEWGQDLYTPLAPGKSIFYVENTYEVKAQRPNRIYIYASPGVEREVTGNGQTQRQFLNPLDCVYVNDGKQCIEYDKMIHYYSVRKGMEKLGEDANNFPMRTSINWLFEQAPMAGYNLSAGKTTGTQQFVVYEITDPKYPGRVLDRIYFDQKTGNMDHVSHFSRGEGAKDPWIESFREEYKFWDFDAPLPRDTFSVRPPRNYMTEAEFEKQVKALDAKNSAK